MSEPGSALEFLDKHIWVPIVACILFLGILALIIYCVYRYRRRAQYAQYDYSILQEEITRPMKVELEKKQKREEIRDLALLNCSFYLRANGKYEMREHLPEIGSRLNKQWFRVQDITGQHQMLTMMKKSSNMVIDFNKTNKNTLTDFFKLLYHPYLYPTTEIDFVITQELVVVIQPFSKYGSLKDIIYGSHCLETWQTKYCFKSKGLPVPQIQLYGRQILELLLYFEDRNLPLFTQLHSGNIMVEDNVCGLTGYESTLLDYPPKLNALLKKTLRTNPDAFEQLAFGHLLFEMAAGYELDNPQPEIRHYQHITQDHVKKILQFIFTQQNGAYPALRQIVGHEFFKHVDLKEDLRKVKQEEIPFPNNCKDMLKQLRRKSRASKRQKDKSSKNSQVSSPLINTWSSNPNYGSAKSVEVAPSIPGPYATTLPQVLSRPKRPDKPSSGSSIQHQSLPPKPVIKAKPVQKPRELCIKVAETETEPTTERSALLSDIRKGVQLKKSSNNQT